MEKRKLLIVGFVVLAAIIIIVAVWALFPRMGNEKEVVKIDEIIPVVEALPEQKPPIQPEDIRVSDIPGLSLDVPSGWGIFEVKTNLSSYFIPVKKLWIIKPLKAVLDEPNGCAVALLENEWSGTPEAWVKLHGHFGEMSWGEPINYVVPGISEINAYDVISTNATRLREVYFKANMKLFDFFSYSSSEGIPRETSQAVSSICEEVAQSLRAR